jgi:uncharacterized repeat protein (TIGR03803 family)
MKAVSAILLAAGLAFAQPVSATDTTRFEERVVYSFAGNFVDGQQPQASLLRVKNTLYGTTADGGSAGAGTLFALHLGSGQEKVLHSFAGTFDDGGAAQSGLVDLEGVLYGTTIGGEDFNSAGTVFAYDPGTHAETPLHRFCTVGGCADGAYANAGLIDVKGKLYGTTLGGGASGMTACNGFGCGTVFSLDPATGVETVIYSFCAQPSCADGNWPMAALLHMNGKLYGTTQKGGTEGMGTVFAIDLKTGAETVVHSFAGPDGAGPLAGLIAVNGMLFGTTENGGVADSGTVFSLEPMTGTETVLHSFCSQADCADGANPFAGLTEMHGTLYGTAANAGANERGTVFGLDPTTGALTVIHAFGSSSTDGQGPAAALTDVRGTLYGTTLGGGDHNSGTVYALEPC